MPRTLSNCFVAIAVHAHFVFDIDALHVSTTFRMEKDVRSKVKNPARRWRTTRTTSRFIEKHIAVLHVGVVHDREARTPRPPNVYRNVFNERLQMHIGSLAESVTFKSTLRDAVKSKWNTIKHCDVICGVKSNSDGSLGHGRLYSVVTSEYAWHNATWAQKTRNFRTVKDWIWN